MKSVQPWKVPPRIKVLEALGALADDRLIRIQKDDSDTTTTSFVFRCVSSNRDKQYDVKLVPSSLSSSNGARKSWQVACNDNGSLFQGYVGYPAIAALLFIPEGLSIPSSSTETSTIPLDTESALMSTTLRQVLPILKGVPWKELAVKVKNDWSAVERTVILEFVKRDEDRAAVNQTVDSIWEALRVMIDVDKRVLRMEKGKGITAKRARE